MDKFWELTSGDYLYQSYNSYEYKQNAWKLVLSAICSEAPVYLSEWELNSLKI